MYVNPLLKTSCPSSNLTKEEVLENINEGKIKLQGNDYIVIEPNTTICDFNLTINGNDFATGFFVKNFNEDILYNEMEIGKIGNFLKGLDKFLEDNTIDTIISYKLNKIVSFKCLEKSKYYLYLLDLFNMELPILDRFENTLRTKKKIIIFCNKTLIKLNDRRMNDDFILSYSNSLPAFTNGKTKHIEINLDLFNFLLYSCFFLKNKTETTLENELVYISNNTPKDKKHFVFLYACQESAGKCSINKCYSLLTSKKSFRPEFKKNFISGLKPGTEIDNYSPILINLLDGKTIMYYYEKII